jgi:hypothetical protein
MGKGSSGLEDEEDVELAEESSDASATAMRLASAASGVEAAEASKDKRPPAAAPPSRSMEDRLVVAGSTGTVFLASIRGCSSGGHVGLPEERG